METDTLKEIAAVIKDLGDNGTYAFVWYLVTTSLTSIINTLLVIGGIMLTVRSIARGISNAIKKNKNHKEHE